MKKTFGKNKKVLIKKHIIENLSDMTFFFNSDEILEMSETELRIQKINN